MDQRLNVSPKKTAKQSKFLALSAFFIAILISYFLISTLSYRHKMPYSRQSLSLPKPSLETSEPIASEKTPNDNGWRLIQTHSGDSLSSIFKKIGLSSQTLQAVLHNNPYAKALATIKPNQTIQFLIHDRTLQKFIFPISATQFLVISQSATQFLVIPHNGKQYVSKITSRPMETHNDYITATVQGSLYNTARRNNISSKLIQQMTDIFNWEIDFRRDIRSGDQFSIIYKAYYLDGKMVNTGDIIAVTFTNRGVKHEAIRHTAPSGDFDYYNAKGTSLKKAFSRYPVKFSHISSTYSRSRYHPILHYRRAHKGVDLAAPIGTPVYATGEGRVEIIERHSGYGNMVKISHNKTFSSLYAHLLRFQKGLAKGMHVKRGQVIGYVGQTGLADGPHCHYEFHINRQPKNPSTVDLPRASPVSAGQLSTFKANAHVLLAQLKLYEEATLAASGKKRSQNV